MVAININWLSDFELDESTHTANSIVSLDGAASAVASFENLGESSVVEQKTPANKRIAQIANCLRVIHNEGSVFEVRALDCPERQGSTYKKTYCGYFDDVEKAAAAIAELDSRKPLGIYVTLNPVHPDLLARCCNRVDVGKSTTADSDITSRRWLFIDVDPERPSGISSTDGERELAKEVAKTVKRDLTQRGWPQPLICSSGNGWHLLYRIDLPNDEQSKGLMERCLKALAKEHSTPQVGIDTSVFNAGRITRCYGTMARKGDSTENRPHRQSVLWPPSETLKVVPTEMLDLLASEIEDGPTKATASKPTAANGNSGFNLDDWLRQHNVPVTAAKSHKDGRIWHFTEKPPLCGSQHGWDKSCKDAFIREMSSGAIAAKCSHDRCNWKWQDLRQHYEPGCYERDSAEPVKLVLDRTSKNIEKTEVLSRIDNKKSRKTAIPERMDYVPFPSKELPQPLADYIEQLSEEMRCDASFVALPLLAGLGAAIGNRTILRLKKSWRVPSTLWCVVVAGSGSVKSAPAKKALEPLDKHQMRLLKAYDKAMSEYEKQMIEYEKDLAEYKKSKENLPVPERPVTPVLQRCIVNDTTVQALGSRLNDNPKGLLAAHDELSAWFCSFERFSKSNDSAKWLEFYSANQSIIDRQGIGQRPYVIPRAFVGVTGTIQPGILRKHLTSDYKSSGLAARLLFAMPPKITKQWTDFEVDEHVEQSVAKIFDSLLAVEMPIDEDGNPFPATVKPDTTALELFKNYYNRHNRESVSLDEDLGAAYAKLEEVAARLALVIHCVRFALGEVNSLYSLDVASMAAGIELTEWFKQEARRVYAVLADDDIAFENRQVIQWIETQGRPVTVRDVYRAHRNKFQSQEEVELLLTKMVREGVASSETGTPTEQGGRPVTTYSLSEFGHNPENLRENRGSVLNGMVESPKAEEWKP